MKYLFISLVATFFFLLSGCSDNTNNPTDDYMVIADFSIDNDWQLNFKTNTVYFHKLDMSGRVQRTLTSVMVSGSNTYTMILSVFDDGKGVLSFKLTDPITEGQASVSWTPDNPIYNTKQTGQITLTKMTDDEWFGSFHFEATDFKTGKTIKVNNGKLKAKKNLI
jgi:hypothetical protein